MKIEYTLKEEDFLEYQLYITSLSKSITKKRLIAQFGVPILYIVLAIGFYFYNNNQDAILICVFLGALWLFIYPFYSKYRYKRFYLNYIKKNYAERLDHVDSLRLGNKKYFYITEQGNEGKVEVTETEKLIELKNHFFIQMKAGGAIILPKSYILNIETFKKEIANLNIEYLDDTKWRWN